MEVVDCAYRGDKDQDGKLGCRYHGQCLLSGESDQYPVCDTCQQRLPFEDPNFALKWRDPLLIVDRERNPTSSLRNLLAGGSAFLVCGGPSAKPLLSHLNRRGVFSLAVNNAAGKEVRPQAMVFSDPPSKFSHSIWLDKGIMKFCPTPKMGGRRAKLRRKVDGKFQEMDRRVCQMPNVWGFQRWSWMTPDDQFFLTEGACWGNHQSGVERTGEPKTVCTMLLGIRLLYYLGARKIFLVGVDFRMGPDYEYSFEQERTPEACDSNNSQFWVVNRWLCEMRQKETFKRFGLSIFNCFDRSGLRAFPHLPFAKALEDVIDGVEQVPDLAGWYEK